MSEERPEPPQAAVGQPVQEPEPARPAEEPEPARPAEEPEPARPVEVRLRRAPRYRVFIGVGAVLGAVLGVVLAVTRGGDALFSAATVTGYLAAIGLLVGALLGGVVAVLADRPPR